MEPLDAQRLRILILTAVGLCIVSPLVDSIFTPMAILVIVVGFFDSRHLNQNRSGPRPRIVPRQNAQKTVKYKQTTRHQHHHPESLKRPDQLVIHDQSSHDTDSVNSFDPADELLSLCRLDRRTVHQDDLCDDVFLATPSNWKSLPSFSDASCPNSQLQHSSSARSRSSSSSSTKRSSKMQRHEISPPHENNKENTHTLLLTTDDSLKRLLSTWADEHIRQFQDEIDDTTICDNDLFLSDEEIQLYRKTHCGRLAGSNAPLSSSSAPNYIVS
ncbi:Oidioi.mRNA.OKI2018_I69.chr1.g2868.t1.cds [Oikopleura dioica]|uniref:Oidioi.mRNA.OKI2018_I69.chr1.g2868.t1.cds n=1 Tax=Oikopleura dioica TaxID=34765 RepID=A0ABN7SSD5_OIKDI|nr:Oidioi.mRNA.OKI2018_I69.chr1.g2868.t1.cds [Oikopleura dioica]